MSDKAKVKAIVATSAIYVPFDCEGIRIDYMEDDCFYGTGEETGESYNILYEDVNLKTDMFYSLQLVNHDDF